MCGRVQKHPPEVFYQKNCSSKFRNIQRKTPELESLFNKAAGLKNTYSEKHLQTAAFEGP